MTAVSDHRAAAIVAARLTPDESQLVFRRVLEALARPGRLAWLPADVARRVPPTLVPLLALCDLEVTSCVVHSDAEADWGEVLAIATGTRPSALADAAWVAALRPLTFDEVADLQRGDAARPERGARLVHSCRELHMGAGEQPWSRTEIGEAIATIEVRGPGVPGMRRITVTGVDTRLFEALESANRSFPAGVDTWLVADSGAVLGLARTTQITVVHHTTRGAD